MYINNAGLVILHPFLPELFKRIGLLEDKQWKDAVSQDTAVMVLQYLISAKKPFPNSICR